MNAQTSMAQLLEAWPSAALTLFARFGVGSRDKMGFRPQQTLEQVLASYLVFDCQKVLDTLWQVEEAQQALALKAESFSHRAQELPLLDCRSQAELDLNGLPRAMLLSAPNLEGLSGQEILLYDAQGPMAGAAAQHLRRQGFRASFLRGGLQAWAQQLQPTYPIEQAGALAWILPDWCQLRWRGFPWQDSPLEGNPSLLPFACQRVWKHQDYLALLLQQPPHWPSLLQSLQSRWSELKPTWAPQVRCPQDWQERLQQALVTQVQPKLNSHKGQIELVGLDQGVAQVRLSGGCQGCSSAAITVAQEVAQALYVAVPELEGVVDASDHLDPGAQPHH